MRLFLRQDLDPVAVGVGDEVEVHGEVFVADAAHGLMMRVGGVEVVRPHGEVEFVFAEVVRLFAVFQPRELELVRRAAAVAEVDEREARQLEAVRLGEAERFFLEREALFEVEDVDVVVREGKVHGRAPFF